MESVEHRAALAEIIRTISVSLDAGAIFNVLERETQYILAHTGLWVLLRSPQHSPEQWTLAFSTRHESARDQTWSLNDASFIAPILANQAVVVVDFTTTARGASLDQAVLDDGGRAGVVVPIHVGSKVLGALLLTHATPGRYEPEAVAVVEPVADLLALALEHERLDHQASALAVVEERNRLAREIHDTLAQSLTAIILNLESLKPARAAHLPLDISVLEETEALARSALTEARRSVLALYPTPLAHQSLRQALAQELDHFGRRANVATQFYVQGAEQPIAPDQATALFRIAQEALQNIYKHAGARTVLMGLTFGTEAVTLSVEDDGVGFDSRTAPQPDMRGGSGLGSMEARTRSLGGHLDILSTPGHGTRVQVNLPYARAPIAGILRSSGEASAESVGPVRVLIVDDHPVTRQGLQRILEGHPDLVVVGEAEDGLAAVEKTRALHPHVVLLDLQMPKLGGLAAIPQLRAAQPGVEVVVLTTFDQEEHVFAALKAGARGYLLKDTAPELLLTTIRAAARGESLLPPALTTRVVNRFVVLAQRETDPDALNTRELEVLTLMATGAPYKVIATQLHITPKTVQYHVGNILGKLQVRSRGEAVAVATERGLLGAKP